jgi:hypothetical protein
LPPCSAGFGAPCRVVLNPCPKDVAPIEQEARDASLVAGANPEVRTPSPFRNVCSQGHVREHVAFGPYRFGSDLDELFEQRSW